MTDSRKKPQIPTCKITRSAFLMMMANLGSLNALERVGTAPFLRKFLGGKPPSVDTVGRVMALISPESFRDAIKRVYVRMKRNRVPPRTICGFGLLVMDGHESHCTCRQRCDGCLERTVITARGERTEYYHRHVLALLPMRNFCFLLDAEPQRSGENEVAAATRLLDRVLQDYPRAFDIVVVDALYACAPFLNHVVDRGKHFVVVLKKEKSHAMRDARGLFDLVEAVEVETARERRRIRAVENIRSWDGLKVSLRVVQSLERTSVRRRLTKKMEELTREWCWATDLEAALVPDEAIVDCGHDRWTIENQGFNETVNEWNGDHVYKHEETAMLNFYLLLLLAYNLFHIFLTRNLAPNMRKRFTKKLILQMALADLVPPPFSIPLSAPT